MPDIIRLLPDHIANQIAAGEVIQRPASVVKELLENAIDAGASKIKVIIKDAGKTLIQVIDNGKGMTPTDARMSLERHATSKIRKADDLFAIATKGFRGEALASIASVSQLELKTMQEGEELGSRLLVTGSKVDVQEPIPAQKGTDIAVKKLFFNIPARRKFLKSDTAEFRHILLEFNRLALAHSDVQCELYHNDKLIIKWPAETELKRVIGVLGKSYKDKLVRIEEETEIVSIHGFVGTAESAKVRRDDQFLFINGRFFKSPYFNHAITSAYSNLIQDGKHPGYVLFMQVDPTRIDVNVHPTKQEIKFEDDRAIYNYLKVAVRHAIARHHMIPLMDFEPDPAIIRKGGMPSQSGADGGHDFSPITKPSRSHEGWENIFEGLDRRRGDMNQSGGQQAFDDGSSFTEVPASSKTFYGYIVRTTDTGLLLIDQRAAHIRILYEDFMQRMSMDKAPSQGLLFPKTFELPNTVSATMEACLPLIKTMGFDVAPFGQDTYVLHGVPAFHEMVDVDEGHLIDIIKDMAEEQQSELEMKEKLAFASAKQAAIAFDKRLSDIEISHLVEQLFACALPDRTPGGQLCYIILPREEIDKKFNKR